MSNLTLEEAKRLRDTALRMKQTNQTNNPQYRQILVRLVQFQQQQRQLQQQIQSQQTHVNVPNIIPSDQQLKHEYIPHNTNYQQSSLSTPSPLNTTTPIVNHAQQLMETPIAQTLFSDKQLEFLHNQIKAFKQLCQSMDTAVAKKNEYQKQERMKLKKSTSHENEQVIPKDEIIGQNIYTDSNLNVSIRDIDEMDKKPTWTRASQGLFYIGPLHCDGDLLNLEKHFTRSESAYLGPYRLNSPTLELKDTNNLKKKYIEALLGYLTTKLKELEKLEQTQELNDEAELILRDLRCILLQYHLRKKLVHQYHAKLAGLGEPQIIHRPSFRRHQPISRLFAAQEESEKRRASVIHDKSRRVYHQSYLKAILHHSREFMNYHKTMKSHTSKMAKASKLFVEAKLSKAEREEDRQEKLRLKALKANDMEAYGKLVAEAKNERLTYLLSQTNAYLESIRQLVRAHKQKLGTASEGLGSADSEGEADDLNYIDVAAQGELPRQPMMLVGGDLKEYQLRGLQWMVSLYENQLNGILADEMGLGKTIQSIALLTYITEIKNNRGPFLVVVPLSTLSNWVNEFKKWAPDLTVVVYKGPPNVRKELYRLEMASCQFNVVLTTYEYIMKDKHVLRKYEWQYIIVDEGHRMKNSQSKFAMTLGTMYVSRNRLLLTGTPLQNSLPELWALLNFLLPTIFESVDTFEQWFSKPFASFSGSGESNELSDEERMLIINRLHQVLRPFLLRRVKANVLDQLPDKVEKVLKCDLSGWQKIMYRRIQEQGALLLENSTSSESNTGTDQAKAKTKYTSKGLSNVLMQLRKVCNHPYLFQVNEYPLNFDLVRSSGKFELLDRMLPKLQAAGHRVLMFSQMTQLMHVLEDYFQYRRFRYLRLDGSTSADEREQRMFQFNSPDSPYFIFLLSTRAGGLGLNLATADTVVIFDSDWNPAMDAQAQDRAHRIGQKNEVRVFRLVTNSPVEEKILSRATDKMNMNNLIVEAGKFNNRSKEAERRAMLESLMKMEADEAKEKSDEGQGTDKAVLMDDEINEMMALTEEELQLYQRMDRERTKREAKEFPSGQSRLMTEKDVPSWLSDADARMDQEIRDQQGDNNGMLSETGSITLVGRKRKEISYREALSEFEFVKMCEMGIDDNGSTVKKDSKNRSTPKAKSNENSLNDESTKGRSKKKRKVDDNSQATFALYMDQVEAELINQVAEEIAVRGAEENQAGKVLCYFYKKIFDSVLKLSDGGRNRTILFYVKPSALDYPDYYSIVKTPMDLVTIKYKIDKHYYTSHDAFEADFNQLVSNAKLYNPPHLLVYHDAVEIERTVDHRLSKLKHKSMESLQDEYDKAKEQHKRKSIARKEHKRKRMEID